MTLFDPQPSAPWTDDLELFGSDEEYHRLTGVPKETKPMPRDQYVTNTVKRVHDMRLAEIRQFVADLVTLDADLADFVYKALSKALVDAGVYPTPQKALQEAKDAK